ncbi:hypothetical protein VNO78_22140 [Psophocarpus tetragonolobus]|uniref:Uncharacterized protein n=1 Tax=Psophocarpus tetragonolobus TaxID=3891 RepID=A0AAN9SHM9_PSOTE
MFSSYFTELNLTFLVIYPSFRLPVLFFPFSDCLSIAFVLCMDSVCRNTSPPSVLFLSNSVVIAAIFLQLFLS